jgi:hypothetical protein
VSWGIFAAIVALLICALTPGCTTTVIPQPVEAREASFDGATQNSGIIMSTENGFVITDTARARYNLLIATYGRDFLPPLKPDGGVQPIGDDRWLLSKQGMVYFLEMSAYYRAGLKPKNP